jgi:peptidoglycan/xylan/chitin deacetylase (PgdA/CDA1 family)
MSLAKLLKIKATSWTARQWKAKAARLAGHRPVASITFDDFPKNAWTLGGPVLARHGVRGTYYTAGGFCGRTEDGTVFYDENDLRALAAAGHEIACHGFGHQPTPSLTTAELEADAERNLEFLRPFLKGAAPVSYAYPYGKASLRTKAFLAPRFSNLRGVHPGINAGRVDLAQLNTISLEARCWDQEKIEAAIQRARHEQAWLIFYTHDVSERPTEYGSTPGMLDWALSRIAAARITVLPVKEALPVALGG